MTPHLPVLLITCGWFSVTIVLSVLLTSCLPLGPGALVFSIYFSIPRWLYLFPVDINVASEFMTLTVVPTIWSYTLCSSLLCTIAIFNTSFWLCLDILNLISSAETLFSLLPFWQLISSVLVHLWLNYNATCLLILIAHELLILSFPSCPIPSSSASPVGSVYKNIFTSFPFTIISCLLIDLLGIYFVIIHGAARMSILKC